MNLPRFCCRGYFFGLHQVNIWISVVWICPWKEKSFLYLRFTTVSSRCGSSNLSKLKKHLFRLDIAFGRGRCVAVQICPQFWLDGESIEKMHFVGTNPATDQKAPKCICKISKTFRAEKSGEISRNLRFSRFFVHASKSYTYLGWG